MFCPAVSKVAMCCLFKAVFVLWRRFGGAPAFSFCRRRLACFKPRQVVQLHTRRLLWLATEDSSKLFQQSRASSEVAAELSPWPMKKYTCEEQMMEQYHKFSLLLMLNTLFNSAWDNFLSNENHPPYFLGTRKWAAIYHLLTQVFASACLNPLIHIHTSSTSVFHCFYFTKKYIYHL